MSKHSIKIFCKPSFKIFPVHAVIGILRSSRPKIAKAWFSSRLGFDKIRKDHRCKVFFSSRVAKTKKTYLQGYGRKKASVTPKYKRLLFFYLILDFNTLSVVFFLICIDLCCSLSSFLHFYPMSVIFMSLWFILKSNVAN